MEQITKFSNIDTIRPALTGTWHTESGDTWCMLVVRNILFVATWGLSSSIDISAFKHRAFRLTDDTGTRVIPEITNRFTVSGVASIVIPLI